MDNGISVLETGFSIDPMGSFETLTRLKAEMVSADSAIGASAGSIERKTSGMLNIVGAKASITSIVEASRETAAFTRAKNATEKAGEGLIRVLEREAAAFGKTRDEIRSAKVEVLAMAAAEQGNTDLAARLRAAEQMLWDQKFAAMRRERQEIEALAEDRAMAAQRAEDAAQREAQAIREAGLAHQMFEAKVRQGVQAMRDHEQAAAADERSLHAIRTAIDPLYAAEQRLLNLIKDTTALRRAEKIGDEEFIRTEGVLVAKLDEVRRAQQANNDAVKSGSSAAKLARHDLINLSAQLQDVFVSLAGGQNPMTVFIQQGSQIGQISATSGVGLGGMAKQAFAVVRPFVAAAGAVAGTTAVVVAGAAAWLSYTNALERMEALAQGSGRVIGVTGEQLEANAESAARAGNITIGAARDIEMGYVKLGGIGAGVLTGLTAMTTDFAKATGQDAAGAMQQLGTAFQDPVKGAEDLTARFGVLDQKTIEHIQSLVEANDKYGAQAALLAALEPAFDGAADHANVLEQAWQGIATAASGAWNWMGKAIDRALGGGTAMERLNDLYAERDRYRSSTMGMGDTSFIDKQIAEQRKALERVNNAAARASSVGTQKDVDAITGNDTLRGLKTRLAAMNAELANAARVGGLSADALARTRQAQDALNHAVTTYIPVGQKQIELNALDAKLAAAKTPAQKASIAAQRERLQMAGQIITTAQAEALATGKGTKALGDATRAAASHANTAASAAARREEAAARETAAVEAQIKNTYALTAAFGVSGAEALIAEARVKAESQAIKQRGDVEEAVARQVRLTVALRITDAAKSVATMRDQAAAQASVNDMVTSGLIPSERAADLVRDRMADLPLLAAIEAAQKVKDLKGIADATKALDDQRKVRAELTATATTGQYQISMSAGANRLAELREELSLIGATEAARVHAMATLKAAQDGVAGPFSGDERKNWEAQQVQIADADYQKQLRVDAFNESLHYQADLFDAIANNVTNAGQGMADAFGNAGRALGDLASGFANYIADQERMKNARQAELLIAEQIKDVNDRAQKQHEINTLYATRSATAQIGMFGDMASAAKGFFKDGSDGYKAMAVAEKTFRAIEFALSVRAMAQDAIHTVSSIANSGARTAVKAVEAVVSAISSLPFPLNLAAGAATIGALASIGVGIAGSFGGGKGSLTPANIGTGTVLGDSDAKSESIKRAIDSLKEVDTIANNYAREMMGSLRSIDSQIGNFAAVLVRSGDISASAGVNTGFKSDATGKVLSGLITGGGLASKIPVVGGIIGAVGSLVGSLFGSKTSVIGSGLFGGAQSVGSIVNGGFDASYYSDVQKKKKFLGLTTGTSYSTKYGEADAGLENQFTLILRSFNNSIAAAAGPLGVATGEVQARLNSFVVSIGKIDLQDLTGAEIEEKLTAVFGAAADGMANAAFPGLERFQKVGEGAFETLVRVASTVEAVTNSLDLLGASTRTLGIDAKVGIADQFESVSAFTSATDAYFQSYYSKEEQAAARTAQFAKVFDSLGLAMPGTLAGFRALVEAQNLTTTAGQSTYATLLQLAPAFSELQTSMNGVKSATDILSERQDLERKLLELRGDSAAIRALDLAKLDASNRALQLQIYAIQDAQEAAKAADELRTAWKSVGDSIMEEVNRIRGLNGADSGGGFASLMSQFNAATVGARAGDQDLAKSLPGLSQALLKAAADAATSRQELDRVQAMTAASLEATYSAIGGISGRTSTAELLSAGATAAQASAAPAAANDDMAAELRALRDELALLRADTNAGNAAIAGGVGKVARHLDNVTAASGGEAIAVAGRAA